MLIAGAVFEVAAYNLNLGHFSNAATLWLGMKPATSELPGGKKPSLTLSPGAGGRACRRRPT